MFGLAFITFQPLVWNVDFYIQINRFDFRLKIANGAAKFQLRQKKTLSNSRFAVLSPFDTNSPKQRLNVIYKSCAALRVQSNRKIWINLNSTTDREDTEIQLFYEF